MNKNDEKLGYTLTVTKFENFQKNSIIFYSGILSQILDLGLDKFVEARWPLQRIVNL